MQLQQTPSRQQAACSGQHAADNKRHAPRNRQHAQDFKQHAADNNVMQRNMQHAACNGQRGILEKTIYNRQQGNKATRQQGNKATRQQGNKATCGMQQTPRRRRHNQATHATDNVQQTADDMQEDASSCEMQREPHGTAAYRVQRAAGSGQLAACAKHCSRQPVRNTAQTPHKMQHTTGAAACSKHTRNRHRAAGMETYEMRRTEPGRSRTSTLNAGFWLFEQS